MLMDEIERVKRAKANHSRGALPSATGNPSPKPPAY